MPKKCRTGPSQALGSTSLGRANIHSSSASRAGTAQAPRPACQLEKCSAIRQASQALGRLDGCVIYASGHPCPM
ncbi:hypothetical protein ACV33H_33430, partial [Pseudomonas aeruginosa]